MTCDGVNEIDSQPLTLKGIILDSNIASPCAVIKNFVLNKPIKG